MALIPIKFNEEVLGMFQINCFRKYAFTLEDIYFIERLSSSIGVSIHQKETKRLLEISESALNRAQKIAKICSWTNMGTGADHTYNISKNIEDIMGIVPDNGTVTLKQIIEVIHKDDKKLLLSQRETGRETGKPYSYDFRIIKNGRIRHIHLSAEPIIINDELQGYAGIVQDITQRKIAQIRLEENKSFLDLILQGIRAAIIIVDPVKRKNQISQQCSRGTP